MKRKLLVIEVDNTINKKDHRMIHSLMENYQGEVVSITNAANKIDEIKEQLPLCDDFAFQTFFIQESYYMVEPLLKFLMKIKKPLNIYIGYDERLEDKLVSIIRDCFKPKKESYHFTDNKIDVVDQVFHSIKHHNIFRMKHDYVKNKNDIMIVDFSQFINRYENRLKIEKEYESSRKYALTGQKVKIKNTSNLTGDAWSNLKEGDIVDVIDCKKIDPRPNRGVWVWGNGEPVKILNENPYNEYELIIDENTNVLDRIIRETDLCYKKDLEEHHLYFMNSIIDNIDLTNHEKAQKICDHLQIERRGNRSKIREILSV